MNAVPCTRPDCTGTGVIDADGYCTECGLAPLPAAARTGAAGAATGTGQAGGQASVRSAAPSGPGAPCVRPDCTGTGVIDADGYCTECGLAPLPSASIPAQGGSGSGSGSTSRSTRTGSTSRSARTMSGRSRSARTGRSSSVSVRSTRNTTRSQRGALGAGLVTVPPIPKEDPRSKVLANPEVAERKRYCSSCETPVGRSKNGVPGRTEGFCTKCGTAYSFTPKLFPGDLVGGQYEVVGCLAHGGLGWIYLGIDRRVNDKWIVLKGLLDTGDEEALAVAIAERRYLAEVDHPNIVRIINFVEHPDPRKGTRDGYIVMEYVGGKSLKDIADARRLPDGRREPLPVEQAIAYALEALPALGYLHQRGLIYCDFKLDNVIQSEDQLKIIDMGAVRRQDDDGAIYGTIGYQAPEVAAEGVSPASDLYTVARALAVMSFDFQGFSTVYRDSLPGPEEVEVFDRYESYYRLLVRATDQDAGRRFSSAQEMAEQLTGVLREVLALQDGKARPALSTLFGPELRVVDTELLHGELEEPPASTRGGRKKQSATSPDHPVLAPVGTVPAVLPLDTLAAALALPVPRIDPGDPNAGFLASLMATAPDEVLGALNTAPVNSVELRLRRLRALIETGDLASVHATLTELGTDAPDDWRVVWYRGLAALAAASAPTGPEAGAALRAAAESFDAVYDAFPGEAAPKLALGVCAEALGEREDAAEFYRLVWTTDRSYVSAAFGLARVLLASGDRPGTVAALESVPKESTHYVAARIATVRARLRDRAPQEPLRHDLDAASQELGGLGLDARRREELSVEVLGKALGWVLAGRPDPAGPAAPLTLLGRPAEERTLRFALEDSYRKLARLAESPEQRIAWVERANRTRPRTWV
ncbi:serine/threonine-protein kinase PknG [Streptacidiphilus jiangxiensis]|uniref:non-specific serine/threonine protein kinase n=2 Tax=Streptacidiphilus jiangxiensis TaxID=235985 RepID=A0A1H7S226_STRJI|nr:serine/threonine-protein kinase [Streptacidiphilus jiangxiensis]SEL66553.1 serine/threonine-protein kinase PknG [Streptacidiphilus jiangxiensis]